MLLLWDQYLLEHRKTVVKIACLLLKHLPCKIEIERTPRLTQRPFAVIQNHVNKNIVLDVFPVETTIIPGMSIQEAKLISSDMVYIEADMETYQKEFNDILLNLSTIFPDIESGGLGCIYISMEGLNYIYGNDKTLINAMLNSVPTYISPSIGISKGKFPAYLAALSTKPRAMLDTGDEVQTFLSSWPIDVLPIDEKTKHLMHNFGLDSLGKLRSYPLGPIQAQFGSTGKIIWLLAHGLDNRIINPYTHEESFTECLILSNPTALITTLNIAIDTLLRKLFSNPYINGKYSRLAFVKFILNNGDIWQRRILFKTPAGNSSYALSIIKSYLSTIKLSGLVEELCITLGKVGGETGKQMGLFKEMRKHNQITSAIEQINISQGKNHIYQIVEVEPWSRIPERRHALIPFEL